jgi:hypothetical protein
MRMGRALSRVEEGPQAPLPACHTATGWCHQEAEGKRRMDNCNSPTRQAGILRIIEVHVRGWVVGGGVFKNKLTAVCQKLMMQANNTEGE